MIKKYRMMPLIIFFMIIFPVIVSASSKPTLVLQKNYGVHPAVLKYSEYEYRGSIVSVVLSDPKYFHYSIAFANPPKPVSQFHHEHQNALLTINGGYWDYHYLPTDLCIVEGKVIKPVNTKNSHYGLFAIRYNGDVVIDNLKDKPLSKTDLNDFIFALKSGPHLIRNGIPVISKSVSQDARTVICKSRQNQVLFVITKSRMMTYAEMTDFLMNSGFDIIEAFNLDGGSSTGFVLGRGTDRIFRDTVNIADVIQLIMKVQR